MDQEKADIEDCLINHAGILTNDRHMLTDLALEQLSQMLNVNLISGASSGFISFYEDILSGEQLEFFLWCESRYTVYACDKFDEIVKKVIADCREYLSDLRNNMDREFIKCIKKIISMGNFISSNEKLNRCATMLLMMGKNRDITDINISNQAFYIKTNKIKKDLLECKFEIIEKNSRIAQTMKDFAIKQMNQMFMSMCDETFLKIHFNCINLIEAAKNLGAAVLQCIVICSKEFSCKKFRANRKEFKITLMHMINDACDQIEKLYDVTGEVTVLNSISIRNGYVTGNGHHSSTLLESHLYNSDSTPPEIEDFNDYGRYSEECSETSEQSYQSVHQNVSPTQCVSKSEQYNVQSNFSDICQTIKTTLAVSQASDESHSKNTTGKNPEVCTREYKLDFFEEIDTQNLAKKVVSKDSPDCLMYPAETNPGMSTEESEVNVSEGTDTQDFSRNTICRFLSDNPRISVEKNSEVNAIKNETGLSEAAATQDFFKEATMKSCRDTKADQILTGQRKTIKNKQKVSKNNETFNMSLYNLKRNEETYQDKNSLNFSNEFPHTTFSRRDKKTDNQAGILMERSVTEEICVNNSLTFSNEFPPTFSRTDKKTNSPAGILMERSIFNKDTQDKEQYFELFTMTNHTLDNQNKGHNLSEDKTDVKIKTDKSLSGQEEMIKNKQSVSQGNKTSNVNFHNLNRNENKYKDGKDLIIPDKFPNETFYIRDKKKDISTNRAVERSTADVDTESDVEKVAAEGLILLEQNSNNNSRDTDNTNLVISEMETYGYDTDKSTIYESESSSTDTNSTFSSVSLTSFSDSQTTAHDFSAVKKKQLKRKSESKLKTSKAKKKKLIVKEGCNNMELNSCTDTDNENMSNFNTEMSTDSIPYRSKLINNSDNCENNGFPSVVFTIPIRSIRGVTRGVRVKIVPKKNCLWFLRKTHKVNIPDTGMKKDENKELTKQASYCFNNHFIPIRSNDEEYRRENVSYIFPKLQENFIEVDSISETKTMVTNIIMDNFMEITEMIKNGINRHYEELKKRYANKNVSEMNSFILEQSVDTQNYEKENTDSDQTYVDFLEGYPQGYDPFLENAQIY